MEQNSNAEKQARHRKKKQLKQRANQILINWQIETWKHHLKGPQEIQDLIETAIKLPSGWTDEDYLNAERRLDRVYLETAYPTNQLSIDVRESRNISYKSISPSDLRKAEDNTNALASHIISALKLSSCNEADQTAALMQALRFVGRNLTNNREVPCSQATTMCLATIGPTYARPSWYAKEFANTLSKLTPPELLDEILKHFIK